MGDPLIGAVIADRYRVTRKLGQGGMGSIYEVVHVKLKRSFVLKRLAAGLAGDDDALMRFQREAEVVASLRHPNIVEISDWETLPDETPCMILEYLRGEDLDARIERGPLAWPDLLHIADQAISALSVAHRAGVIHRDLKPHNIFLALDDAGGEHVKLLDFGISKIRDSTSHLTGSSVLMGTPAYMSPEQAHGRSAEIGPATDVWSMGAILYEMITGRQPFVADSIPSTLLLITTTRPDPIVAFRPDAPATIVSTVEDALSLDPARRIRTIEDLRARLAGVVVPTTKAPISSGPRTAVAPATTLSRASGHATIPGTKRKSRWIVAALAAAVAGVGAFVIVSSLPPDRVEINPAEPVVHAPKPEPVEPPKPVEVPKPAVEPPPPPVEPVKAVEREIHLVGVPAGATLLLDGKAVRGDTLHIPDDGKRHRLSIRATGFDPDVESIGPDTPAQLVIKLQRTRRVEPTEPKPIDL